MFTRRLTITGASLLLGALMLAAPVGAQSAPGLIHYMPTLHGPQINDAGTKGSSTNSPLSYHGGTSDGAAGTVGVETAPTVYLVFWGSQWTNNDPSGEAAILQNFFGNVGASTWNGVVTQYCQGVPSGTTACIGGTPVGNLSGMLAGSWSDSAAAAPRHPTQNQLASEAVRAAAHFANTTAGSNSSVQYVIATSTGNSSSGFGSRYCAWHSSTSSSAGNIAYTNLPYITDAGASCGANFNGLGANAGITIVGGHEFAETETDQFPSTGWTDSSGSEIGDKCAWNSATSDQLIGTTSFPVQPLWSNKAGGCSMS